MARFQIIKFAVVSVIRKSCPRKEIHVYSLVIQTMRKCNRTAFLRSVFVWLLQLLTLKVKLFEPKKTIVFVISQIAIGGWIMFSFFSVQKTVQHLIQTKQDSLCWELSVNLVLQRRRLKSKITFLQSVRNTSQKRKHWQLGDCTCLLLPNPQRRRCCFLFFFPLKK